MANYIDKFGVEYSEDKTKLIRCPIDFQGEYAILNSVTSIEDSAFEECLELTSVTIPDSVTHIGDSAFLNCTKLTSINLPNSVKEIEDLAFLGPILSKPLFNDSIFVRMPYTYKGKYIIPSDITTIHSDAFEGCEELSSIVIPASVFEIGNGAFCRCKKLHSVYCNAFCPPRCDYDCFLDVPDDMIIYVPEGRLKVYEMSKEWANFKICPLTE